MAGSEEMEPQSAVDPDGVLVVSCYSAGGISTPIEAAASRIISYAALPAPAGRTEARILGDREAQAHDIERSLACLNPIERRRDCCGMRFTGGVLVAVLVLLAASTATADYRDVDPDDSAGIDIVRVASNVFGSPKRIRFRIDFFESIEWRNDPGIRIEIDSTRGRNIDRTVFIGGRRRHRCELAGGPDVVRRLPGLVVGSNFVSCEFRRNLLPRDGGAIRWRVVATYLREELADDLAPGGERFYPRV